MVYILKGFITQSMVPYNNALGKLVQSSFECCIITPHKDSILDIVVPFIQWCTGIFTFGCSMSAGCQANIVYKAIFHP